MFVENLRETSGHQNVISYHVQTNGTDRQPEHIQYCLRLWRLQLFISKIILCDCIQENVADVASSGRKSLAIFIYNCLLKVCI